ncbi:TSL-kinase interacting protein 1, partial [Striga asiatica]
AGKRRLKRRFDVIDEGKSGFQGKFLWGGQGERHCYKFGSSMSVSQSQIDVVLKIPLSLAILSRTLLTICQIEQNQSRNSPQPFPYDDSCLARVNKWAKARCSNLPGVVLCYLLRFPSIVFIYMGMNSSVKPAICMHPNMFNRPSA